MTLKTLGPLASGTKGVTGGWQLKDWGESEFTHSFIKQCCRHRAAGPQDSRTHTKELGSSQGHSDKWTVTFA
jgi:hypothetical protein